MYTNMLRNEVHGGVLLYDISDHLPIFCTVLVKPEHKLRSIKKLVRDLKKFDRDKFVRDIFDMVENFSFNDNDDIDEVMNNFISSFKQITDMQAPLRLNSRKEQKLALKPWITKGILKSIKTKNRLFNQRYKRNNSDLIIQFKHYSNKLTTVKRIAKQDYFMPFWLELRNNVSQQWKIINKILEKNQKKTHVVDKLVTDNGTVLTDSKAICNELNNFFVSIGPIMARGGVEDTRLEAKAKDTKKIRGQGQGQPFRGQTLSRPRTGMLEAKAKDQGHKRKCSPKKKRSSQKFFKRSPQKNVFQKIFQALHKILTIQKILLSSSRGHVNFRGLEASRPRPRTSKSVLEAKYVLEGSTSDYGIKNLKLP